MKKRSRRWKYRNTTLLVLSLIALFFLADTAVAHALIKQIGSYGYFGALITGIFFVSTFTVAPASIVLFHLAQDFNPFLIALCAGAGGVIGDLLIFRFLRDGVFEEIQPFLKRFKGSYLHALIRTRYFIWLAPVVGAVIIASASHFWKGILAFKDQLDSHGRGNSYTNWKQADGKFDPVIEAVLQSKIHVIFCMRSKMDYVLETDSKGKQVPKKVGLDYLLSFIKFLIRSE